MTTYTVDPDALHALAARLQRTGDDLATAGGLLRVDAAGLSAGPSAGLDDALQDLVRAWRSGLQRTGEAAIRTAQQLQAAARAYADVDAQIARACP